MQNRDKWEPSKYVFKNGKLIASRDRKEVSVASRLIADLVAAFYGEALKKHAKGRLLDLGCGKVPLYSTYKEYIKDNICVDWENTLHKNIYLDFECDLTRELPFDDCEFDTIILSDVLEHIPQPEKLWQEMHRILSVGGNLIINVPFYYCIHESPHDYYRYTEFALERFVENSKLALVQLDRVGGAPEVLADILSKNIQYLPVMGIHFAVCIQYITKVFINTRIGKKISEVTSEAFPFGYFLVARKN